MNLGSLKNFIIDDDNAYRFRQEVDDPTTPFTGGFLERDFSVYGEGFYAPRYTRSVIPRRDWPDLIKRQDEYKNSPWHFEKHYGIPVLDQNGLGYCWMYGVVAGVMNRYACQGIPVPHLSATGPAAQGKRWKNEGGWAGEAVRYIDEFGIPTVDTWPEHYFKRDILTHEMELDAARHKIVEFEELESQNFDMAMSCLLDPEGADPVTLGLMWWGHLVCGVRGIMDGNKFGIVIKNSWKPSWGDGGFAVLMESKATAHEYLRVKRVTPRAA